VPLDLPAAGVCSLASLLSEEEFGRACRHKSPKARTRAMVLHGALRLILGGALGRSPRSLRFASGAAGKPRVVDGRDLHFSLSDSDALALIAVASGPPVGVDLERLEPIDDPVAVGEGFLSPAEHEALRASARPLQTFYEFWTRKEAYLKAVGAGLMLPMRDIEIGGAAGPRFLRLPAGNPAQWSLVPLRPAPGYVGALAVPRPSVAMRAQQWVFCRDGDARAALGSSPVFLADLEDTWKP